MNKPSIFKRLQTTADFAVKFFRHGSPYVIESKKQDGLPYSWPTWRTNTPQWHIQDYQTLIDAGFNRNSILYSAAIYKYQAFKAIPMRAYIGTFKEPELLPADHWLQKLCLRPNRFQSGPTFQGMADIFLNISGTCYIYIKRVGDRPESMYLLRPDRVFIVPTNKGPDPIGYYYVPEGKGWHDGVPYQAKDIMVVRMPNPGDPLDGLGEGLAPASVAAKSINVDNMITDFLQLFFQNGAMPPGYFSYDVPMQPEEIKEARQKLMEIYGGYDEWSKVAVLDQGGKYTRVGLTFAEMDMSKLDGRNQSLIVSPFGVPLTLLTNRPELVSSTYNNKAEDRKMFWQDRMYAESKEFESEYQYYLQGDRGEFVMFDFSEVPALTLTPQERAQQAKDAFESGGILRNEYRAAIKFDPVDDGDVYLVPSNVVEMPYRNAQELQAQNTSAVQPVANPPEPDDSQAGMPEATEQAEQASKSLKFADKAERVKFWIKANEMAEDAEPEYRQGALDAFERNKRALLAIVSANKKKALQRKQTPNYDAMAEESRIYLETDSPGVWKEALLPAMTKLMTDRIVELNRLYGSDTSPQQIMAQQWFDDYMITFAQPINDTTNKNIVELIAMAQNEGWGADTLSNRMGLLFDQWMMGNISPEEFAWLEARLPEYRTEMIARTETIGALNYASNRLYEANGWGSEWLATPDNRTREAHADADGQIKGADGYYDVGGERLRYPGDKAGSAENVINCRCVEVAIIP